MCYYVYMIYGFLSTLLFLIVLPFWYLFSLINPKLGYGFKQKLGFGLGKSLEKKSIVFYGVSVGEIIAIENLIRKSKETFSNFNIVVCTGTKTGQELAKKKLENIVDYITYFPFDFPFCIQNFIKKVNPKVVVIAETELWPSFAYAMKKNNIPLCMVNGRLSDRTYGSYKKLSFFFAPILKKYTKILTQSESDNAKLVSIGANPQVARVMGNLKFDIVDSPNTEKPLISHNDSDKIIIAGSTHSTEDEIVLNSYLKIRNKNTKLLIAPRHIERADNVFDLSKKTGLTVGRYSSGDSFLDNEIIVLDALGSLSKMYSICKFSFIGGSFNKTGGHNPLECCIYNKPVISGSSVHNFKDIYAIITKTNAGVIVKSENELVHQMQKLLSDDDYYKKSCNDCKLVFEQNLGATNFAIKELSDLII